MLAGAGAYWIWRCVVVLFRFLSLKVALNTPCKSWWRDETRRGALAAFFACAFWFPVATTPAFGATKGDNALPARIQTALNTFKVPTSAVSIVVRSESGEPVLQINGLRARNPASTIKILTSFIALETLGPAFTWPTQVHLLGILKDGRLQGDIAIKGFGDPYLVMEDFWKMLRELRRKGVREISGDLVVDDTYFASIEEDMGAFDGRPDRLYNVIPNAAMVNFQSARFIFNPSANGVNVDIIPPLPNLKLKNSLKPVRRRCGGYNAGIRIDVENDPLRDLVKISGAFPDQCEDYSLARSVLQPDSYLFGLFKQLWTELGGSFSGGVRRLAVPTEKPPFLVWRSRPFREIMTATNKFSNNLMTRMLLLTVGAELVGPPASTAGGIQAMRDFLQDRGYDISRLVLDNGSGLSRKARTDAWLLSEVLVDAYHSPFMPEFIASLPINGHDGTMRKRLRKKPLKGRAHVKTGRLDNVSALAGYVQARSGKRYVVVYMLNHRDAHRGIGNAIGDEIVSWVYQQ